MIHRPVLSRCLSSVTSILLGVCSILLWFIGSHSADASGPPECKYNVLSDVNWDISSIPADPYSQANQISSQVYLSEDGNSIELSGTEATAIWWTYKKDITVGPGENLLFSCTMTLSRNSVAIADPAFNSHAYVSFQVNAISKSGGETIGKFLGSSGGESLFGSAHMAREVGVQQPILISSGVPETNAVARVGVSLSGYDGTLTVDNMCLQKVNSFDLLVQDMNRYYSHFREVGSSTNQPFDWDVLAANYRDEALLVESNSTAFGLVLVDMLRHLEDIHVQLSFGGQTDFVPTYEAVREPRNYSPLFTKIRQRLDPGSVFQNRYVLGREGSIGYFQIKSLLDMDVTPQDYFDRVLRDFKYLLDGSDAADGIILDLRNNGGGDELRAREIASLFNSEESVVYGRQLLRAGYDIDDFYEALPERALSARDDGMEAYSGPVVVITGNDCVSSCEGLTMMLRVLPTVTVVGNYTGGASGNPSSVLLGNGVSVSYSRWVSLLPDGRSFERVGIEPDLLFVEEPVDDYADPTYEFAVEIMQTLLGVSTPAPSPSMVFDSSTIMFDNMSMGAHNGPSSIILLISISICSFVFQLL